MNPYMPNSTALQYMGLAFNSLCTILVANVTKNNSSEESVSYVASNLNLIDIPCRVAPLITVRPSGTEKHEETGYTKVQESMAMLNGYYPDINLQDRAVIDGVTYNITAAEPDGQRIYTRLRLEMRTPVLL